jgi:hypothetical protein
MEQPDIYQISWVTPDNFNPDKISIQTQPRAGDTYERFRIMYQYDSVPKDLVVTVPKDPDAYLMCRGVQKDVFVKNDHKIETNRYGAQFVIDSNNKYHMSLYKMFEQIITKIHDLVGLKIKFPAKDTDTYSVLYTNLIHANDGRMFSSAYTKNEQLDILNCKQCIARPALLLSALKSSATEMKIKLQVSQMYVHEEIANFPLAYKD